ncbi:MAG: CHAT domain-containing protein, partial [Bacteroidota bacterium]
IAETQAKAFAGIPDTFLQQEQQLKVDIAALELVLAASPNDTTKTAERSELFAKRRQYEDFVVNLEKEFPQYYQLKFSQQAPSTKQLQTQLDRRTALVSYFISEKANNIEVFYLTKKRLEVYTIPLDPAFYDYIALLRNAIRFKLDQAYLLAANALYKQLLPKKLPKAIESLIIVPDGPMSGIPFEALLYKEVKEEQKMAYTDLPYLLTQKEISYAYASSLLLASEPTEQPTGVLLYAPVSFEDKRIPALPGTEQEVNAIGKIFEAENRTVKVVKNRLANELFLKETSLSTYGLIHFATHGFVNEQRPALSGIFLQGNEQEDGILYTNEIYNLRLNAQLVTLSACETGLGKLAKGEGLIGLTRALLYAGAQNIAVSLWKVSDKSTTDLMNTFYEGVAEKNATYKQALRKAKLAMIQQSEQAKPYHWAAFVLIGK